MEELNEDWIIKEYTNKEKDFNVRLLKHHLNNDYAIQDNRTMEIRWGYTKKGAHNTFRNIVASWEGIGEGE